MCVTAAVVIKLTANPSRNIIRHAEPFIVLLSIEALAITFRKVTQVLVFLLGGVEQINPVHFFTAPANGSFVRLLVDGDDLAVHKNVVLTCGRFGDQTSND